LFVWQSVSTAQLLAHAGSQIPGPVGALVGLLLLMLDEPLFEHPAAHAIAAATISDAPQSLLEPFIGHPVSF
jgi:hypothetical protein